MNVRLSIGRMLAVLVIWGLVSTPLVTPASAMVSAVPGMSDMATMTGDMPCCPDEQKSKACHDCPLVAMCVLKTVQTGPSASEALPLRHAIRTTHAVRNDVPADGLTRPPPDHPPRILA